MQVYSGRRALATLSSPLTDILLRPSPMTRLPTSPPIKCGRPSFHTTGPLQKRLSGVDTGPACSTGHVRTAHGRLAWPQVRQHKERQLGKVMGGQRRRVRSRDVLRWGALPVLPPRT